MTGREDVPRRIPTCARVSNYCDLNHPVETYLVEDVFAPRERRTSRLVLLCRFHGQAYPKVGETPEETQRRTRHVRSRRDAAHKMRMRKKTGPRSAEEVSLPEGDG